MITYIHAEKAGSNLYKIIHEQGKKNNRFHTDIARFFADSGRAAVQKTTYGINPIFTPKYLRIPIS